MQIEELLKGNRVVLAPMAGITDHPFRLICKKQGCGIVYSEMINARGLLAEPQKYQQDYLYASSVEKPLVAQLFGSDPEVMASAGVLAWEAGADLVDINMGCSVPKVLKNREGAYLMKDQELAGRIMEQMVRRIPVPVMVKMRKGWENALESENAVSLAEIAAKAGIKAVVVHGRTVEQRFTGEADWEIIREVREAVDIPVIGNGDVTDYLKAEKMLAQSDCHGIMVGRGVKGNPWLLSQIKTYLHEGRFLPGPSAGEIIKTLLYHLQLQIDFKGEKVGAREMRKHASWYIKGMRGAASARELFNRAVNQQEFKEVLEKLGRWNGVELEQLVY